MPAVRNAAAPPADVTDDAPFLLGIDPGADTGLAGYVPGDRGRTGVLAFVRSASPLGTVRLLETWAAEGRLLGAVLEDSRHAPLYHRHRSKGRGERDRIARSVGRVDQLIDLYLALLSALDVPVQTVEPVRAAKWSADDLRRITGFDGRSNQHGRDGARIVFSRRVARQATGRTA